jgi:hypothetical protein
MSTMKERFELVQKLTHLLVDDEDVQSYVKGYLLEHKFGSVPTDEDSPAYEIWYEEYTEELRRLLRDVIDNLVHSD